MSILMAAIVPHPPIILPQIGQGQEHEIRTTIAAYRERALGDPVVARDL